MAEYSPSWAEIAAAFGAKMRQIAGLVQVYDRYPDNRISVQDLPCAVIVDPSFTPTSFTFGTVTIAYAGTLDIPVLAVSTAQPEISKDDANRCRQVGINLQVAFHTNRTIEVAGRKAFVVLGAARIVRLSPVAGGNYAGIEIPYTVSIQYASN